MLRIININKWSIFFILIIGSWMIQFALNEFLMTDEVWYSTYGEQMTVSQIDKLIDGKEQYWWLSYALVPLLLVIKVTLISVVLIIGAIFFDEKLSFKKTFGIALIGELIFLLPGLLSLIWFSFFQEMQSMTDLMEFTPWSIIALFDLQSLEQWMVYAISVFNVFEGLYILSLVYMLSHLVKGENSKKQARRVVLYGYGSGLFTWVVFVTFLIIKVS